jgi:alkylation response protein AidB-like acyl-CoA dehydrogenase
MTLLEPGFDRPASPAPAPAHVAAHPPTIAGEPVADAARLPGDDTLIRRFAPLFARIAERAVQREQNRKLAHDELNWLREAGFTRLRVPRRYGGDGISLSQWFSLLMRLGEADSNLPQILRAHGGFIESLIETGDEPLRERWFTRIVQGAVIGGAVSERTGATRNTVRVVHDQGALRLDGEKYYTTGALYADWIDVSAHDGQSDVRILVAADTPGVECIDDWDGFGQRLTGSGTTRFHHVTVPADHLYRRFDASVARRDTLITAYYQTVHLANLAGITRAVLRDATTFAQARTRTFGVPGESHPRDNPLVQRVIGRLASLAFSTASVAAAIAYTLDEIATARAQGRAGTDMYIRADIQAFQAQQIIIEQTLEATTLLFEVGGASATSDARRFDRYWRNARVLASHNPAIVREAAIGNFYLNGEAHNERFSVRPATA